MAFLGHKFVDCGLMNVREAYLEKALDVGHGLTPNNQIVLLILYDLLQ